MRDGHNALAACDLHKPGCKPHVTPLSKGCVMDSLYASLIPASVALAIIGYSLFLAYA
jgi:hypothetical protein